MKLSASEACTLLAGLIIATAAGCVDAAPVARIVPKANLGDRPGPVRTGRVMLDVEGETARVYRVESRVILAGHGTIHGVNRVDLDILETVGHEELSPLCTATPCVVELPLGQSELAFETARGNRDTSFVTALPELTMVRHRVGFEHESSPVREVGAGTLLGLGLLGVVVGPVLLIGGNSQDASKSDEARLGGGIMTGAGVAMLAAGAWLLSTAPEMSAPGPTAQWKVGAQ